MPTQTKNHTTASQVIRLLGDKKPDVGYLARQMAALVKRCNPGGSAPRRPFRYDESLHRHRIKYPGPSVAQQFMEEWGIEHREPIRKALDLLQMEEDRAAARDRQLREEHGRYRKVHREIMRFMETSGYA